MRCVVFVAWQTNRLEIQWQVRLHLSNLRHRVTDGKLIKLSQFRDEKKMGRRNGQQLRGWEFYTGGGVGVGVGRVHKLRVFEVACRVTCERAQSNYI
jgi:hypothetical protein